MTIQASAATEIIDRDPIARLQLNARTHMPALDGLRGLAIITVVWHNTALTGNGAGMSELAKFLSLFANMGWVGVQLFFVLSGFLITGILLDEKGAPQQLRNFYMRRVLRIFPIYYAVLLVAFIILPALGSAPIWSVANKSNEIWYWLYLVNWDIPIEGGGGGLSHFWSLAVEEQFYLMWPLAVIALSPRALSRLCLILVVSAPIARAVMIHNDLEFATWAAYEFTFSRWDALAIGALLALVIRHRAWLEWSAALLPKMLYVALAYVAIYVALNHNFAAVAHGLAALNQSVAALLFAAALFNGLFSSLPNGSRWQALLGNRALRTVGKYSYAIYVFHFPIVVSLNAAWQQRFGEFQHMNPVLDNSMRVLLVALFSYLLAVCSWYVLEQPCLRLKRFFINAKRPALQG
ncbi:MAG TPA: acyltransferase [Spongiibacteraceae bacterium]|nr:acyltransferase [Spongiibacteraceae bacterium]